MHIYRCNMYIWHKNSNLNVFNFVGTNFCHLQIIFGFCELKISQFWVWLTFPKYKILQEAKQTFESRRDCFILSIEASFVLLGVLEGVPDKWKNMHACPYYDGYNPNL